MNNNNTYKTSDLALAATLSLSFPIQLIDKSNPRRVDFIFDYTHELQELVELCLKREAKVEPFMLYHQLRYLKSRIYD